MNVGLILPVGEYRMDGETARWSDLLGMSQQAEVDGFDSVWVVDHLIVSSPTQGTHGVWECLSLISALAASTNRVKLGTLVLCVPFRNPALLAKMAETIDEISGGRLILGLGAGHHQPEFDAFGFPFDHRVSRFEEAIQIIHGMLRTGSSSFDGRWNQTRDVVLRPRGPRPDGPPIMVGTTGKRMLRITARYADEWNVYFNEMGNSFEGLKPVLDRVDAACDEVGRPRESLSRSVSLLIGMEGQESIPGIAVPPITGSVDEMASTLMAFRDLGVNDLQVRLEPNTRDSVAAFAPVVRELSNV
jgi:probable F420-dependent oxidoreductase